MTGCLSVEMFVVAEVLQVHIEMCMWAGARRLEVSVKDDVGYMN